MQTTSSPAAMFWASLVRTIVPVIAGSIIAWLASVGFSADSEFSMALEGLLVATFTVLYYAIARLLETYVTPKFGWLLGMAKAPASYSPDKPTG